MTTQPKTTADVIIGAVAEWKDGKIYWEDCTAIIRANLSALSSELSALQQQVQKADDMYSVARALVADQAKDIEYLSTQNRELREMCKVKDEALQLAHDNWSDCFHDAVSTCKICKALALQPEK